MIKVEGTRATGALPPLTDAERAHERALRAHVSMLAGTIGRRSMEEPQGLAAALDWLEAELRGLGLSPKRLPFRVGKHEVANLETTVAGAAKAKELVVVGAHYDAVPGTVGANDNGSGVAAVLLLAKRFAGAKPARTIRFVFFVNEEMPHFQSEAMGSLVYARACRARKEQVAGMLSLETLGHYSDAPDSQAYPGPLAASFPTTGNFVAFASNEGSAPLLRQAVAAFRQASPFPVEGAALPADLPGVGWSDHWAFWQAGYSAVMVTDTAPFRYPHYHTRADTPDKLRYDALARVVTGLEGVVRTLAR